MTRSRGRPRLTESDHAFRREVALKFEEAMRKRGLNQTMAAQDLGVTKQALSQYLNRDSTPQGRILARACAKWGIKLKFREAEFGGGAFGVDESAARPEVFQMDLFREPQVIQNAHVMVIVRRAEANSLQVTIKMKKVGLGRSRKGRRTA